MKDKAPELYRKHYKLCHRIVERIVGLFGRASRIALRDELYSEAWITVLEYLPHFKPDKGMKLSTYLWGRIYWRLHMYIRECELQDAQRDEQDPESFSTECAPEPTFFEYNPYQSTPDVVYESKEKLSLWQKLKSLHPDAVAACITTSHAASSTHRASLCRRRKMALPLLQRVFNRLSS